jgi:hypothetical protein
MFTECSLYVLQVKEIAEAGAEKEALTLNVP